MEKCEDGYVWKEYDVETFGEDVVEITSEPEEPSKLKTDVEVAADNTTVVTYTVMFYYTPGFAEITWKD